MQAHESRGLTGINRRSSGIHNNALSLQIEQDNKVVKYVLLNDRLANSWKPGPILRALLLNPKLALMLKHDATILSCFTVRCIP